MFGHAIEVNFSKQTRYNTLLGGVFSIPVYVFMIIYIVMVSLRIDNELYDHKSSITSEQPNLQANLSSENFDIRIRYNSSSPKYSLQKNNLDFKSISRFLTFKFVNEKWRLGKRNGVFANFKAIECE